MTSFMHMNVEVELYVMGQGWFPPWHEIPRNGRWTEPADAEDVEAEVTHGKSPN